MEYLAALAVATIGAVGSVVAAYVAHKARQNTKPISNGFAPETLARLARIEELVTNHINDHAQYSISIGKKRKKKRP